MIDIQQYKKVLDSGLLLDHYLVLLSIRDGTEMVASKRVQGFINLLTKKGYLDEERLLSEKAISLVGREVALIGAMKVATVNVEEKVTDFGKWVLELHGRLQSKILELTGKRQVRSQIRGKTYPFLPNSTDLGKVLYRAITAYKLKDLNKIEEQLYKHILECNKSRDWFPLMNYYIIKENQSKMVTDMENTDDSTISNASITIV